MSTLGTIQGDLSSVSKSLSGIRSLGFCILSPGNRKTHPAVSEAVEQSSVSWELQMVPVGLPVILVTTASGCKTGGCHGLCLGRANYRAELEAQLTF